LKRSSESIDFDYGAVKHFPTLVATLRSTLFFYRLEKPLEGNLEQPLEVNKEKFRAKNFYNTKNLYLLGLL
jgi:hypothetical protein